MSSAPRKISARLSQLLELFVRNEDWLIMVNADPDAMAAALALRRIMSRRAGKVVVARINEMTRPDNLAMVRYLRIPMIPWSETLQAYFQKFAIVDSQPHHNPTFAGIPFSIVVDHHPLPPEQHAPQQGHAQGLAQGLAQVPPQALPHRAVYSDIRPHYGSTSTIFSEYLRGLGIRPGSRLATALLYGIRTDTGSLTRKVIDADIRAYQWLASSANTSLLTRITRSEYLPEWLPYFTRAFTSLHEAGKGRYAFLGEVENPDILVVVADFFTRVHGLRWVAICGVYGGKVVIIFRGDGLSVDLGSFAAEHFGALGSAGGHRAMARAEFPLEAAEGRNVEVFVYRGLLEKIREKGSTDESLLHVNGKQRGGAASS